MEELKGIRQDDKVVLLYQKIAAAVFGGVLGVFILIGIGFASGDFIHNAAHDSRHANSFPCH
jgi:cobalt transporter subunit CbtB